MPTSFQFGSREVVSRANVQTSVISATLSGLPSTMVPALSRVTEIICDTKRTVSCAVRSRSFGADQLGLVDRNEARLGLLLVLLAILDHGVEALIDLRRQQVAQRAAVAIGEGQHDHLIGAARAGEEMPRIERGILRGDGVEALAPARCPARPDPSSARSAASPQRSAPAAPGRSSCPESERRCCPGAPCTALRAARS